MKGKLIVIEGGDGSGKTVQSKLLVKSLRKKEKDVEYIEFPRYSDSFYGALVGRFLAGEFGRLEEVSPYLAAIPYALDRLDAREMIVGWLKKGSTVVANRYVPSSMAHQAAKLVPRERDAMISWIEEMEYRVNKLPKPDIVIYLDVPWRIGMDLTHKQSIKNKYVGNEDIAERDINHRIQTEMAYRDLSRKRKNWIRVDCTKGRSLMSIENIQKKIQRVLAENKLV